MDTDTPSAAALAYACEAATETLLAEADDAARNGNPEREAAKRAAVATVLRYADHIESGTEPLDVAAAERMALAARMGGILMAGTTIAEDQATSQRLAEQGWFVLIEGVIAGVEQIPFYAISGYQPC